MNTAAAAARSGPARLLGEDPILDLALRPPKDALLSVVVRGPLVRVHPVAITLAGTGVGVGAAVAAGFGAYPAALALWLLNRLLDGVDGAVAREANRDSDLGAYLDIVSDHVVAAALALGVAFSIDSPAGYLAAAVLLATYYVNGATWMYLSALLEKRRAGAKTTGEATSVTMPAGLIEGTETVVFYVLVLVFPTAAIPLFWGMAVLVLLTALHRAVAALPRLADSPTTDSATVPTSTQERTHD